MRLTARVHSCSEEKEKITKKGDKTTESVKRRTWFRHRRLNVWLVLFFLGFLLASAFSAAGFHFVVLSSAAFISFIHFAVFLQLSVLLLGLSSGRLGDGSARRGSRAPLAVSGTSSFSLVTRSRLGESRTRRGVK